MEINETIKKYSKELAALYSKKEKLEVEEDAQALPGSELESMIRQIDNLIEGDYSRAVFDAYSSKRPVLIRIFTGEEVQWLDAFGDSYDKTTVGQKHALVGLIEGGSKYRFKEQAAESER